MVVGGGFVARFSSAGDAGRGSVATVEQAVVLLCVFSGRIDAQDQQLAKGFVRDFHEGQCTLKTVDCENHRLDSGAGSALVLAHRSVLSDRLVLHHCLASRHSLS